MKFLQRLTARARDPRTFAGAAGEVMSIRIAQGLAGRLTADEARRMVVEKQTAAMRAQLAYVQHLPEGDPRAANAAFYDARPKFSRRARA